MKQLFNKILILILCLVAFSCKHGVMETASSFDYEVKVNDVVEVALKANRTTGNKWKLLNSKTLSVVDSVDWTYKLDKPVKSGSGGYEVWKFKGIQKGIDSLQMNYGRPWEKVSPKKTQIIQIRVY